jgi:hypothetical protein
MLDHVFTDAISALREAFEASLLERQAFEEHFQVDVLLGDIVWETSYGLPGEGLPPRVVAHITFDWPTWSQTSYRRWYIEEALDEHPAVMGESCQQRDGRLAIEDVVRIDLRYVFVALGERRNHDLGVNPEQRTGLHAQRGPISEHRFARRPGEPGRMEMPPTRRTSPGCRRQRP